VQNRLPCRSSRVRVLAGGRFRSYRLMDCRDLLGRDPIMVAGLLALGGHAAATHKQRKRA
jgi:hypothetical protein